MSFNQPPQRPATERERLQIKCRLTSPMRPLDRTSAPVDGLALFDAVRSPMMI